MDVKVDLSNLNAADRAMIDLRASGGGALAPVMNQWSTRFSAYLRRRYARLSKGGGEWAPLAPSTIAARRKGKGSRAPSILADTGVLRNTLSINTPGNVNRKVPGGIEFGIGGGPRHARAVANVQVERYRKTLDYKVAKSAFGERADRSKAAKKIAGIRAKAGSAPTLGQLAAIHHFGLGKVPARPIVVAPDADTRARMASDLSRALTRIARGGA